MEFWGVEVKAGQPLKVVPGDDKLIHLSQASLGEPKKEKGNDSVPLFLKFDDKKLVLGTLSSTNFPQISFDLVFEKEFELSHNWKHGSVYFCGYKADTPDDTDDIYDSDSESEEELDLPLNIAANGNPEPKAVEKAKPAEDNAAKLKSKPVKPTIDDKSDDDDDSDDTDESDDASDLPAEPESEDSDDTDDSDDSDESADDMDEDEETPKKAESGKKRSTESASKTPVPAKKVKLATPQKTDGKKGTSHTATPHPSKQAAKTPANSEKSKAGTPKSAAGAITCNSCSKKFNSEGALQSHSKAKHEGK